MDSIGLSSTTVI